MICRDTAAMAFVHVVANQKGGVGKTTVAVNLAAVLADTMGRSAATAPVLGVSVDPQASMLKWANRVENLPFDFAQCDDDPSALESLRELEKYRHIVVDTPGSLNQREILEVVLRQADLVIVPVEPEGMSFDPAAETIETLIAPLGLSYRVLINNWDPRDTPADLVQTREYLEAMGFPVFNTVIRHYKLHSRASADGMTVVQYPTDQRSMQARQDFFKLALEVTGSLMGGASKHAVVEA